MNDIEILRSAYREWKQARSEYDELIDAMLSGAIEIDRPRMHIAVRNLEALHREFMKKAEPFVYST